MADKTEALRVLEQLRLPIPTSTRTTSSNISQLASFRNAHVDVDYWYLRFDDVAAADVPRVASAADLVHVVQDALTAYPSLSFIVQERLTARTSGVVAAIPGCLFIEHIAGELRALLREGVSPARTLLARDGGELSHELASQEFSCRWDGDVFLRTDVSIDHYPLSSQTRSELASAANSAGGDACVLEWIEPPSGTVVFLDYRVMPAGFLIDRAALLGSTAAGQYRSLPCSDDVFATNGPGLVCIDRPLFEHVESVLPRARGVKIGAGGVLSHFCVYAAERGVPCLVVGSEAAS